uniref:NHL repeat-containing protein 2 n=1 Tax=Sorghum bicolor TaxID=4558 RepID=Q8W0S6_SORBI|nr:hypothetical protein S250_18C08.21 [Sorghum bicolor]
MAQASALAALLRRLRRHRTPAAGTLPHRRLVSSTPALAPASSSLGPLRLPGLLEGDGCGSGLSASLGSHPRPRLPRRHHAAATATRAAHQAASSPESPAVAAASSEASSSTAASQSEIVDFIKSALGKLEGQNHCWLNTVNGTWRNLNEEGVYLVLLYQSCGTLNSNNKYPIAFERLKHLQQRYPRLNVFALQHGGDISSLASQSQAFRTIAKEYITFPILMSDKDFSNVRLRPYPFSHIVSIYLPDLCCSCFMHFSYHMKYYVKTRNVIFMSVQMTNGACYLLFEGSKDPVLFTNWVEEPDVMIKAIDELTSLKEEPSENVLSRVSWQKEEVVKEPSVGSFRNLLLYHPACISVDEDGDRIFISDSNHHRIIISNSNGMILDYIGSSPGFEDGEFESAKFLHPASSFYHAAEDCLFIVDSENHAVRKADFGRRTLETVYPVFNKSNGIWSWITDKLGLRKEVAPTIQDFDADSIALPWHLIQISEDNLLIADRSCLYNLKSGTHWEQITWLLSFEAPWILRISTGEKQDIERDLFSSHLIELKLCEGRAEVTESYQQIVKERCALIKDMHMNWSSSARVLTDSMEKIPNSELISSVARFQNYIIFCDTDGQRVLKHDLDTKTTSNIQFSNCEVLGLPYWFVCNLERVSTWGHSSGQFQEHVHQVDVLPGRCNITVYVDIPVDTELAAPLAENCIWRQVRGSGAEVSGSDGPDTTTEKVGIAQQWYDELDNLAFSEVAEEPTTAHGDDSKPGDQSYQDQRRVQFTCAVNVSPGTCELVASAALYLKLARTTDGLDQKALVKRVIGCQRREEHAGVELLMRSCGDDARGLVVVKPVHLRLRLECSDHPAGTTNKETISTESSLKINVTLD